ncbi:MAG: outer membrane beta-barrel protein [Burkholderiaceae bacterium]
MKRLPMLLGAGAALATIQLSMIEPAAAQGALYGRGDNSLDRAPSRGYVSLNVGSSSFDVDCLPGSTCDDKTTAGRIAVGTMRSQRVGFELAYLNFGEAQTGQAGQKAQGLNLSVLLQHPFDNGFLVFGRLGGTYGYTDTSASLPGNASGTEQGFGFAYGLGVGYQVNRALAVTLEADRHRFKFATGDQDIDMVSLGVRFSF